MIKRGTSGDRIVRSVPIELISRRDYERLADVLGRAHERLSVDADEARAGVVEAARHLSLACDRCRSESDRHRRGYTEARHQERALQRELRSILDALGGHGATESDDHDARGVSEAALVLTHAPELPAPVAVHGPPSVPAEPTTQAPSLAVYCLGPFRVHHGDHVVTHWPNGKGKSIFKYLVTHRKHPVSKEVLMDVFWPNATPHAARNNLNVAIFGLRQAVSKAESCPPCVLFQDGCYSLNPELPMWIDYEVFRAHVATATTLERQGEREAASRELAIAEMLYQGDFLEDNRYEDWLAPLRQSLKDEYRRLLDQLGEYHFRTANYDACAQISVKMLTSDACDEGAHRRLMQCYAQQGLPHLALRQYQLCVEALGRELDVPASPETTDLARDIRGRRAS